MTDTIETERLRLVLLDEADMERILEERAPWLDENFAAFLRMRRDQLGRDPGYAMWAPRLIELRDDGTTIGHAGFHGSPGVNATQNPTAVEVGYTIFEEHRRHGYATEAVRALVEWALQQPGVDRVIASVSPTNEPSLAIVRRLGFVHIGRHWDDEDGEELEFEVVSAAT